RVAPASHTTGVDGLREILVQLDGIEAPARAWERDVLAARLDRYDPAMLDMLCLTGDVAWARLSSAMSRGSSPLAEEAADAASGEPTQIVGATPIALF